MDYRLASVACVRTAVAALDFLTDGTSVFAYNGPTGNLIETRTKVHANVKATIGSSTIPAGDYLLVLRTAYDKNGRTIATSEPFLATASAYLTDPNDLLSNVKSDATIVTPQADLRLTHTIYDPLGRVVETRRLAGAEITMTTVTPQGSSAEFPVTEFDPPSTPDILTASITSYIHDGLGRVTETRAELPNATPGFDYVSTITHYDSLGRRDAQIDPLGQRTEYGHDDAGRLTSVTLPKVLNAVNGERHNPIYSYQYDVYGNQTATTDPKLNITEYTFDLFHRQTSRTLPIGVADRRIWLAKNTCSTKRRAI